MRRSWFRVGQGLLLGLAFCALAPGALLAAPQLRGERAIGTALILLAFGPVVVAWAALQAVIAVTAPGWSRRVAEAAQGSTRLCLLWGGALVLLVLVLFMLLASAGQVGGGIGIMLLAALALLGTLGLVGVSLVVGQSVLAPGQGAGDPGRPLAALVGGALLAALLFIPLVGWIAAVGAILVGLGAAAQALVAGRAPASPPTEAAGAGPPPAET